MDATVYDMFASFKWSMIEFCPMMIEVACKMLLYEYNRAFRGPHMKAAVLEALEKVVVKDVREPECGENEAVLKVNACAVCGSDIRIFHYGNERVKPPTVIGHEIAGVDRPCGQAGHESQRRRPYCTWR